MYRLIKTDLRHFYFGRLFLPTAALMLIIGAAGGIGTDNKGYMQFPIYAILLTAAYSMFITSRETADGTVRNKIICGFTGRQVFFSYIISAAVCCTVLYLLFAVPFYTACSFIRLSSFSSGRLVIFSLIYLGVTLFVNTAAVCITACLRSTTVCTFVLILSAVGAVIAAEAMFHRLDEKKLRTETVYYSSPSEATDTDKYPLWEQDFDDGYIQYREQPNPRYVGGAARKLLSGLYLLDPYGQINSLNRSVWLFGRDIDTVDTFEEGVNFDREMAVKQPFYPIFSLALALTVSVIGAEVFGRKNIF